MAIEVLTKEDLHEFRAVLISDIKNILQLKPQTEQKWLKSSEVKKLLNISSGTLQNLRINGTLSYSKIGGTIFYQGKDIEKILEVNRVNSKRDLFTKV